MKIPSLPTVKIPSLLKKKVVSDAGTEVVLACDLGVSKGIILTAHLGQDGKLFLDELSFALRQEDDGPASVLKDLLASISEESKALPIRSTLKGQGMILRFIQLPQMNQEDLESSMKYEVEQYIPFDINDVVLEFAIVDDGKKKEGSEMMDVLLTALKKQELERFTKYFTSVETKLSSIDVDILAALRSLEFFHADDFWSHTAVLDIGSNISTLGVVRNGKATFIRDISYGMSDIQKKTMNKLSLTEEQFGIILNSSDKLEEERATVFAESVYNLSNDIRVSLDYYKDQLEGESDINRIYVCGVGAKNQNLLDAIKSDLNMEPFNMNLSEMLVKSDKITDETYKLAEPYLPIALGLILREHD